jgi:hypothetical protein
LIPENHLRKQNIIKSNITKIEYIIEYLNNSINENSDKIEKELEEKYKDEIDNLKTYIPDNKLLDICSTAMKTKMCK